MNPQETITVLFGEMKFEPIRYRITSQEVGRWWWKRREFWIECEFSRLGPFNSYDEAEWLLASVGERPA